MPLFENVKFFCASSFPEDHQAHVSLLLTNNGATSVPLEEATHIIANTPEFDGHEEVREGAHVVSDFWMERSLTLGKIQPFEYYSPDPAMLFSGVVACSTELFHSDVEVLSAGISALGGQWREGLTREVTHLFAVSSDPASEKYLTAMHFKPTLGTKVVLPHWFDDTVRLGIRGLPTTAYEWPDPPVLKSGKRAEGLGDGTTDMRPQHRVSGDKKELYRNLFTTEAQTKDAPLGEAKDVWNGKRILLAPDLELLEGRKETVEMGIRRSGGIVVEHEGMAEDINIEEDVDVVIARHRWGDVYVRAVRARKLVGTLTWLFHVQSTGAITPPTDQLVHYPVPRKPIEGFADEEVTVTNYTGQARDYLKKVIDLMGARFTPSMSGKNTVLIAAYVGGTKTAKAKNWNIPVVNHTWLEDCFVQWKRLSVGHEKYVLFPPKLDFASQLGQRGIGLVNVYDSLADIEAEMEAERRAAVNGDGRTETPMLGTEAEDALEVEDAMREVEPMDVDGPDREERVIDVDDTDPMIVEENFPPPPAPKRKSPQKATPKQSSSKPKPKPKPKPKSRKQIPDPPAEELAPEKPSTSSRAPRVPSKTGPPKRTGGKAAAPPESSSSSEDEDEDSPTKAKAGRSAANKRPATNGKSTSTVTNPKTPAKRAAPVQSPSKTPSKSTVNAPSLTPGRTVSVILPPVGTAAAMLTPSSSRAAKGKEKDKENGATKKGAGEGRLGELVEAGPSTTRKKGRRSNIVEVEDSPVVDLTTPSTVARPRTVTDQPRERADTEPSTSRKRGRRSNVAEVEDRPVVDTTTPSIVPRSRRTAADKANQKLHDEIMPDVVNFQKEMRRGSVRGQGESETGVKGKGRTNGEAVVSPRKKPAGKATVEDPASEDEARPPKKRRLSENMKGKRKAVPEEEEEEEGGELPPVVEERRKPSEHKAPSKRDSSDICILSTGCQIQEDYFKKLEKLGATLATAPKDCTVLIVSHLARTEKFLCAMAVAPFIVHERWVKASVLQKTLLPPDREYSLTDPVNEKKWGFKLAEALHRAKENGGRIFGGMSFYITPKVKLDKKLMKNVITAHGGQLRAQTPTVRMLEGKTDHYVISCAADRSIWSPLVSAGHTIYTQELVLNGALRQEIRWEEEAAILST
ncbi:hypothetical protein OF83DRAFT_1116811 [Amylostereum chailletii]|nr:hypothetical protein OF83DRAFT_1116811 [Amylostereum chailletii]